jgi:hypothetical protein
LLETAPGVVAVAMGKRNCDPACNHTARIKAGIDRDCVHEAVDEQPGAGEQDERDRHLADNQAAAQGANARATRSAA